MQEKRDGERRRLAALARSASGLAFLALLALGSCLQRDPTGAQLTPTETSLLVQADLTGTAVAVVVVQVTAPDISTPLVFNIAVAGRLAAGTITLPTGSLRTIRMQAFDAGGIETHSGSVSTAILPGANPPITFVLAPLVGDVPITATLGSFTLTVTPALDTLLVGDTVTLMAAVADANGAPVAASVAWGTLLSAVAAVVSVTQQTARVTATRPGTATVVATYGGVAGQTTIVVGGWYVSPTGSSSGDGSRQPWDLQTGLNGANGKVRPGDTVWLRGGTYVGPFTTSLTGTAAAPIVVRQYPGERATIDGGTSPLETFAVDGRWATYWGFEVMQSGVARSCDSCIGLRPTGVYVRYASDVKLINLIVHDVGHGSYTEDAAHNIEIYGWIVYNGGNVNRTRSDGHGLYVKNDGNGWKIARDNVIFNQFGFGIHAFTSAGSGTLKHLVLDGNILFNNGTPSGFDNPNLQLGGNAIADNDTVTGNMLYFSSGGGAIVNARVGFNGLLNGTAIVRENYIAGGEETLDVGYWQALSVSNNTTVSDSGAVYIHDTTTVGWQWGGNQYWRDPAAKAWTYHDTDYTLAGWKSATNLGATDQGAPGKPIQPQVFVRPNLYERGRAHVAIYNWSAQPNVPVNLSNVLRVGDHYEVRNVQDVFGAPIASGTYGGGAVLIPMNGVTPPSPIGGSPRPPLQTGPKFDAFLVTSSPGN